MRKLEVSLVVCLIAIVILATSTFYFYDLNVWQENQNKNLSEQIDILQNKKNSLAMENENLEDEMVDLESQVDDVYDEGYLVGNESGFQEGCEVGYSQGVADGLGRGFNIRDPMYQEVLQFIILDQTDKNEYEEDTYNCFDFTVDVEKKAFEVGYRCGFVYIEFQDGAHAIVAFNTIDQGLVFIEPQTDEIVDVIVGEFYETVDFWVGTVQSYTIIW